MSAILTAQPTAKCGSSRSTRTRWYRVVTARTVEGQTVIDGVNVEVASGGYFGWGEQAAIDTHVAEHYPGHKVVDTWPIARPLAA